MMLLTFALLCGGACGFLLYALFQFRREYLDLKRFHAGKADLVPETSPLFRPRTEPAVWVNPASEERLAKREVVMRKGVLTGLFIGAVGLLAPFFFALLLNSPWHR